MTAQRKSILVVCRTAPYGSSRAREALDLTMAFAAFDQRVSLLCMGDGVLLLVPDQRPPSGQARSLSRVAGTLPDYGLDHVCVEAAALAERGLDAASLVLPARPLDAPALARLIAAHDVVLTA